jgi:hypothetical protein
MASRNGEETRIENISQAKKESVKRLFNNAAYGEAESKQAKAPSAGENVQLARHAAWQRRCAKMAGNNVASVMAKISWLGHV